MLYPDSVARSCDCWVAMQDATADGSFILAKNSDRPPMEAQPRMPSGARRGCTIPRDLPTVPPPPWQPI
jgi:hypothetical protein